MSYSSVDLIKELNDFITVHEDEVVFINRTIALAEASENCFHRNHLPGHITCSAWITNPEMNLVLMTHHKKLGYWFQLGGHCDEDTNDIRINTMREAKEESGLTQITFADPYIFDLDVHRIPESSKMPEHYHHDIRFWLFANPDEKVIVSEESNDVKWIPLEDVHNYNAYRSITRMVDKTLLKRSLM